MKVVSISYGVNMKMFVVILASMMSIAHAAGGISGGGGNVINPTAPKTIQDPREIRAIILGTKNLLCKYLSAKYSLYINGSLDDESLKLYSVLFSENGMNLHEIMEEIKIDVPLTDGCYDQLGNSFDGSTFAQRHHSVCISAYRIAKSTDKLEVPIQATALILHEFSEVAGLSDDDAIYLQTKAIEELKAW
jgi:hypothetical protein